MFLESLQLIRINISRFRLLLKPTELLRCHQYWIWSITVCQVSKHTFLIRRRHFNCKSIQSSAKIIEWYSFSRFEIKVAKCVCKYLESRFDIAINHFAELVQIRIMFAKNGTNKRLFLHFTILFKISFLFLIFIDCYVYRGWNVLVSRNNHWQIINDFIQFNDSVLWHVICIWSLILVFRNLFILLFTELDNHINQLEILKKCFAIVINFFNWHSSLFLIHKCLHCLSQGNELSWVDLIVLNILADK